MALRKVPGPKGPMRAVGKVAGAVTRWVVTDGRVKYLTGGARRARLTGALARVVDFRSASELVTGVRDLALNEMHRIPVLHTGAMQYAADMGIANPHTFFADGVQALFDHTASLGLPPTDALALVLGNDKFGSLNYLISKEERIRRLFEAQLAAVAEMGVHARGYDYSVIYSSRMIPAMVEYTRAFINRAGFEHGIRFELRQTYLMDNLPFLSGIRAVHQYRAPKILGTGLAASSDSLLFTGAGAISAQYKAMGSLDAVARGGISWVRSGGVITGVNGPDLLAQVVADGLRANRRSWRVADASAAAWSAVAAPAAGTAGWHTLRPLTMGIVDSSYFMNQIIEVIEGGFALTGKTVLNPLTDLKIPAYKARIIYDIFGSSISHDLNRLDLSGPIEEYMVETLVALEEAANIELGRADIVSEVGQRLTVRIFGSHEADHIIEFLETEGVVPLGVLTEDML